MEETYNIVIHEVMEKQSLNIAKVGITTSLNAQMVVLDTIVATIIKFEGSVI